MFESRRYRRKPVLTNAVSVTMILMASVNSVNFIWRVYNSYRHCLLGLVFITLKAANTNILNAIMTILSTVQWAYPNIVKFFVTDCNKTTVYCVICNLCDLILFTFLCLLHDYIGVVVINEIYSIILGLIGQWLSGMLSDCFGFWWGKSSLHLKFRKLWAVMEIVNTYLWSVYSMFMYAFVYDN